MKIKTFKHDKNEECNLCNKIIHTEKDYWTTLIDLDGEKMKSIKFYHQNCLNDLIKGKGRIIAKGFEDNLKKTLNSVGKQLGVMFNKQNTDDKKDIVVEIK